MSYDEYYLNRTLCQVLTEMRQCDKTRNYSYLVGLIEEAQTMGNRMEAAFYDIKDVNDLNRKIKEKKIELKELVDNINTLKGE